MPKILVERPRPPSRVPRGHDGRRFRDRSDAAFLPMKAGYRDPKSLNENLRPLARYLDRQVGRPWNHVYRDICAVIDGRNAIQRHILEHLHSYVAIKTRTVDGKVVDLGARFFGFSWGLQALYVDPRTGLLRRNLEANARRRTNQDRRRTAESERANQWRELSSTCQLHRIEGIWFEVTLAPLPSAPEAPWDVVRRRRVVHYSGSSLRSPEEDATIRLYGRASVYAISKRQLGRRELRAHGLSASAELQRAQ
ncbi:MAG: hypothetical protein ABSE43_11410 [Steroidobacteraceae bacterium]